MINVKKIKIKHRAPGGTDTGELFKYIKLELSDGSNVGFTLNDIQHAQELEWNDVVLASPTLLEFVKITAISNYGTGNNGFSDIQLFWMQRCALINIMFMPLLAIFKRGYNL